VIFVNTLHISRKKVWKLYVCVADETYTLKRYKLKSVKQGKVQFIYKKAFDHLPFSVPHNGALTDEEPTTEVNIAPVKINTCNRDSYLCGYGNQYS
jgi:hypothetical protein